MCLGRLSQPREHNEAEVAPAYVYPTFWSEGSKALVGQGVCFCIFVAGTPSHGECNIAEPELLAQLHQDQVQRVLCA